MKDPRRPLEVHETRDLLLKRIAPAQAPVSRQYTAQERQEALWRTPMGCNPEAYIDFYFFSQQRVGGSRNA